MVGLDGVVRPLLNIIVFTSDGSLYIGNYDVEKWSHDSVKPYHKHILEARKKLSKKRRNHQQQMGAKKQKLEKLQKEIKAAKIKLKELSISKDGNKGGNYDVEKWSHESVKPYHKHILEARKKLSKKHT